MKKKEKVTLLKNAINFQVTWTGWELLLISWIFLLIVGFIRFFMFHFEKGCGQGFSESATAPSDV